MLDQSLRRFHPRQTTNATDANGCLICDDNNVPSCSCGFNEQCILINRDCHTCPAAKCIPNDSSSSSSSKGGVSKGAVAAAVVVIILVLAGAVAAFFWYRRRQRLQQSTAPQTETKPDVPARAEDVLNRPDPNEKPSSPPPQLSSIRIYSGSSNGTINLDPAASDAGTSQPSQRGSVQSNPFEDNHSIQTSSTGAQSNVIPIALVPPGSVGHSSGASAVAHSHDHSYAAHAGALRSDMNLDHVNVSNDSLNPRGAANAASARAGVNENNAANNNRSSYMTTGSFASDFLETSVIVTPTRGTVKQVVGVAKAEVLRAPPSDSLSRSSTTSRPARSPLAASSFGPSDVMHEQEEEQEITAPANPFSDSNSPYSRSSPTPSATTFGTPEPTHLSYSRQDNHAESNWLQEDPGHLYGHSSSDSRPASVYTQASAIVADISSAKRVHLGFDQMQAMPTTPLSAALSTPRSPYRMTNAKLVSPVVHHSAAIETGGSGSAGALEQQQARALQELNADSGKNRMSMSSVLTTSTRADSILESFPFVPPSPISNRPIRTPPRSPLAQQTFAGAQDDHHVSAQETVNRARASASSSSMLSALAPPNRKVLGMSVSSQSSTASNGLGSFTFQIDSGATSDATPSSPPPSAYSGSDGSSMRKRASLDTLALTSDLSSYPLGFDKANAPPVPQVPRR